MALFVLIVVGIVVAQTWVDWRQTRKDWVFPDWAKGTALAGAIAVSLAAMTAFTSVWLQDTSNDWAASFGNRSLWLQIAFLIATLGVIVVAIRKKQLRIVCLIAAAVLVVIWAASNF